MSTGGLWAIRQSATAPLRRSRTTSPPQATTTVPMTIINVQARIKAKAGRDGWRLAAGIVKTPVAVCLLNMCITTYDITHTRTESESCQGALKMPYR